MVGTMGMAARGTADTGMVGDGDMVGGAVDGAVMVVMAVMVADGAVTVDGNPK